MRGLILTLNLQYQDDLRVSTFKTSFLVFERVHLSQFACTPTALTTPKKPTCGVFLQPLIPRDTVFEQSIPTEEDYSTNEALSLRHEPLQKRSALTEITPYSTIEAH